MTAHARFTTLGTRSIVQGDELNGQGNSVLIEDVRDAVGDLVDIIKTYKNKGRLSQVMMSTLFKRRQEEAEAVIEAAVSRLHVSCENFSIKKSNTVLQLRSTSRVVDPCLRKKRATPAVGFYI